MNTIEELYARYAALTGGDPGATATLVLAHSNLSGTSGTGAEEWLTVPEAAERLRVSDKRIYELVQQQRLRSVRAGRGAIRIKASELDNIGPPSPREPDPEPRLPTYVPTHLPQRRPRGRPRSKLAPELV